MTKLNSCACCGKPAPRWLEMRADSWYNHIYHISDADGRGLTLLKKLREGEIWNAILIALGLAFCALGYNLFLIPNNIAAGGFTGLAQLINSVTGWPVGVVSLCLNVPLFAISMKSLGLRFGLRSLIATVGLSLLLDNVALVRFTDDLWLSSLYGGLLCGLGFGLILRGNATTGGTDMLASLLHRLIPSLRVSVGIFLVDGLVILASAFVFDTNAAMYALVCAMVCNLVVDFVLEGPNSSHSFFIISDRYQQIADRIMKELDRGVTALNGTGMYSGQDKQVLLCVVSRMETVALRRIVFTVDPKAFLISTKAHDAFGEGFKDYH